MAKETKSEVTLCLDNKQASAALVLLSCALQDQPANSVTRKGKQVVSLLRKALKLDQIMRNTKPVDIRELASGPNQKFEVREDSGDAHK